MYTKHDFILKHFEEVVHGIHDFVLKLSMLLETSILKTLKLYLVLV